MLGKTTIAAEFFRTQKRHYDAIFWIRADNDTNLLDGYGRIAIRLGLLEAAAAQDRQFAKQRVKAWLESPVKVNTQADAKNQGSSKWLLVFDNVEDDQVLRSYWPDHGPGSIIVTSRDPLAPKWLHGKSGQQFHAIQLEPFSMVDAENFLLQLTPHVNDTEHAYEVAERLGALPLSLRQMARIIMNRNQSFASFLKNYHDPESRNRLLQVQRDSPSENYPHSLSTVWGLEQLKTGRNLLNVIALLDPVDIPEDILVAKQDFDCVRGLDYPQNYEEFQECKQELWRSSLIQSPQTTQRLQIHPVVQDVARSGMTNETFSSAFHTSAALLRKSWPTDDAWIWHHNVSYWGHADVLYNHVGHLWTVFFSCSEAVRKQLSSAVVARLFTLWAW